MQSIVVELWCLFCDPRDAAFKLCGTKYGAICGVVRVERLVAHCRADPFADSAVTYHLEPTLVEVVQNNLISLLRIGPL